MKLIQHLERKLSWRRKTHSSLQNTSSKSESKSRKTKKLTSAAIKVNDSEFSQYIRFASPFRTVPTTNSVPTYEIVNIRIRSPFQAVNAPVSPPVCKYQSPSPSREDGLDMHIYDQIGCNPRPNYMEQPKQSSPIEQLSKHGNSFGPITVTSGHRRNRIKTNPWFNSPWAGRKTFTGSHCRDIASRSNSTNVENDYESIDNLDWKQDKENLTSSHALLHITDHQSTYLTDWNPSRVPQSTPVSHKVGTYLKGRLPHHFDAYPQSPFLQSEVDQFIEQVPSPEFVNQSHQICSEISTYFNANHSPKEQPRGCPPYGQAQNNNSATAKPSFVNESLLSKFDSMETIDLTPDLNDYYGEAMSDWSLHEESFQQNQNQHPDGSISSAVISPKQSPCSAKSRKLLEEKCKKPSKRKRPESIYSTRHSKKVDQLKCQLKEVVHAAILEAKKEDTKKA